MKNRVYFLNESSLENRKKLDSPTIDMEKINIEDPMEVATWCEVFDVSEKRLRDAVEDVGRSFSKLKEHFFRESS